MKKKLHLDISSSSVSKEDGLNLLKEFKETIEKNGFNFGVQLHNTAKSSTIQMLVDNAIPLTVHSPITGKYSLNLATKNSSEIFSAFDENAQFLRKLNVNKSVFHGFSMCDQLIPRMENFSDYDKYLKLIDREELHLNANFPQNKDYTNSEEFLNRRDILKENLKIIRERYPDITFCIENDLPIYNYSSMRIKDLLYLEHPICLDIGHLWASSLLLDFDFYAEVELALQSPQLKMIHFHNSPITSKTPKTQIADGHIGFEKCYELDFQKVFSLFMKYDIEYLVLEITQITQKDIEIVRKMYEKNI